MMEEIEQFERIQDYLRGIMSDEERTAFERDLAIDDTLRKQYEELSLLAFSVRESNREAELRLRESLAKSEEEFASTSLEHDSSLERELQQIEQELEQRGVPVNIPQSQIQVFKDKISQAVRSIGQWFAMKGTWSVEISGRDSMSVFLSRVSGAAVRFAVVGCLAFACIGGFLGFNAHHVGMNYQLQQDISRGADPITDIITDGQYSSAQENIRELLEYKKSQRNSFEPNSDQYEYISSEITELEFLDALCDLRRWRYFSAKKKLKEIASGDGYYPSRAQELLEQLW